MQKYGRIYPALIWKSGTKISLTASTALLYGKNNYNYYTVMPGIELVLYEKTGISLSAPLFFQENAEQIPVWKTAGIALSLTLENGIF
jgi:hypothetical protein